MNEVHTFRCPGCKTIATTTIMPSPGGAPPIKCAVQWCRRTMHFIYSTEIDAAVWQERNRRPVEFRSPYEVATVSKEDRLRKCDRMGCFQQRKKSELLNGRFCSEECGAIDSLEMAAFLERKEQLYQQMPWLRPVAKMKESA